MTERYLFNDPEFAEYVFYCMYTASQEQKNKLNYNELKHFETPAKMRKFAERESHERRDLMLSRLGITWIKIYAPLEEVTSSVDETLVAASKQIKLNNRFDVVKAMAKGKVFAIGTRDVVLSCQQAAQNSHSQLYVMEYAYPKLMQRITDAKLWTNNMSYKDGVKAVDELVKLFLANLSAEHTESICGVSQYEMKILLALYPNRSVYTSANKLSLAVHENIREQFTPKGVTRVANWMADRGLVTKVVKREGVVRNFFYTIDAKGIEVVTTYVKYIMNEAKNM